MMDTYRAIPDDVRINRVPVAVGDVPLQLVAIAVGTHVHEVALDDRVGLVSVVVGDQNLRLSWGRLAGHHDLLLAAQLPDAHVVHGRELERVRLPGRQVLQNVWRICTEAFSMTLGKILFLIYYRNSMCGSGHSSSCTRGRACSRR